MLVKRFKSEQQLLEEEILLRASRAAFSLCFASEKPDETFSSSSLSVIDFSSLRSTSLNDTIIMADVFKQKKREKETKNVLEGTSESERASKTFHRKICEMEKKPERERARKRGERKRSRGWGRKRYQESVIRPNIIKGKLFSIIAS
jgi:hypothetical protein